MGKEKFDFDSFEKEAIELIIENFECIINAAELAKGDITCIMKDSEYKT